MLHLSMICLRWYIDKEKLIDNAAFMFKAIDKFEEILISGLLTMRYSCLVW